MQPVCVSNSWQAAWAAVCRSCMTEWKKNYINCSLVLSLALAEVLQLAGSGVPAFHLHLNTILSASCRPLAVGSVRAGGFWIFMRILRTLFRRVPALALKKVLNPCLELAKIGPGLSVQILLLGPGPPECFAHIYSAAPLPGRLGGGGALQFWLGGGGAC